MDKVELTRAECQAIHQVIDMMGGGNPEYVFSEYSTGEEDDPAEPMISAFARVYYCAGERVPQSLVDALKLGQTTDDRR